MKKDIGENFIVALKSKFRENGYLFDNNHCHDYPQWHYIFTDIEDVDQIILLTGMVKSNSQLKRLRKQNAIKLLGNEFWLRVQIGQRVLLVTNIFELNLLDDNCDFKLYGSENKLKV